MILRLLLQQEGTHRGRESLFPGLEAATRPSVSDALHKWKLLVFKEQPQALKPQQQYLLTAK
jgi:hypothetical protein